MLIILLFIVLFALKLVALALVYSTPPVIPLAVIAALIITAYRIDANAAKPAPQPARPTPEAG